MLVDVAVEDPGREAAHLLAVAEALDVSSSRRAHNALGRAGGMLK